MSEKTKRRWFRFRLRTLLIAMLLICIVLAPLSWWLRQALQRQRAVAEIARAGGQVDFLTGREGNAVRVCFFKDSKIDLASLEALPTVTWVEINQLWADNGNGTMRNRRIVDLSPLSDLPRLEALELVNIKAVDLSLLEGCRTLEYLALSCCDIDDASALLGFTELKHLFLWDNQNSDFSTLYQLKQLETLSVNWITSDREFAALRKALPNCEIKRVRYAHGLGQRGPRNE